MPQVLAAAEERTAEEQRRQARGAAAEREFLRKSLQSSAEDAEWAKMEAAFEAAFPEPGQQREVVAEICRGLGLQPDGQVAKKFTIGKWWVGLGHAARERGSIG